MCFNPPDLKLKLFKIKHFCRITWMNREIVHIQMTARKRTKKKKHFLIIIFKY